MHGEARECVRTLLRRKDAIQIVPQVVYEFWVVATRPVTSNGLGMAVETVKREIDRAEAFFTLLPDTAVCMGNGCGWFTLIRCLESRPMMPGLLRR